MSERDRRPCHRRGEFITTVIVWLLLGAILNIAVAWGLALLIVPSAERLSAGKTTAGVEFVECKMTGGIRYVFGDKSHISDSPVDSTDADALDHTERRALERLRRRAEFAVFRRQAAKFGGSRSLALPGWVDATAFKDHPDAIGNLWFADGRGWPVASFCSAVLLDPSNLGKSSDVRDGIALKIGGPVKLGITRFPGLRVLPTRPIFLGFAFNTTFYAIILWLLFATPAFARRRIRLKRGLCPACAYPVGESATCTECGKPVPTKSVAPT
ncbi:MAG: hypothetical protein L0Y42_04610 [Phycisphaerales bacterium]|nr:hypothetical protein [Phycisphaerales bacterium]